MIGLLKVNRKVNIGWLTHSNLAPSSAAFQLVSIRFNLTWISLRSRQGKALGISPCVSTRLLVQNQNMKFGFYYVDGSRHIHGLHKFSIPYFSVSGNSQFILRRAMEFWFIRLLNGRVLFHKRYITFTLEELYFQVSHYVIGGRSITHL